MIQRIIASILMFALLSVNAVSAYTLEDKLEIQGSLGEYSEYIDTLDAVIPQMSTDKLEQLKERLETGLNTSEGNLTTFIQYVLISVNIELQNKRKLTAIQTLTDQEIELVNSEILALQANLHSELSGFLSSAIASWNSASRYEESGNLTAVVDMVIDNFMSFEGELEISDYSSKTQIFDQEFTGKIDTHYATKIPGIYGGEVDFSAQTNANIIVKDDNVYLKFDNLASELESSNSYYDLDMTPFIERLQDLSENNTYLEFPSEDYLEYFRSLAFGDTTGGIQSKINESFDTPLLAATYKTDAGYILTPTKHFCDMGKEISGIFDPFSGSRCSDAQYQDMLEDFKDSDLQIILSLGNTNNLSLLGTQEAESIDMTLSWNEDTIEQIKGDFINSKSSYYGTRYVTFDFKPTEYFSAALGDNSFTSELSLLIDNNGNIYSGNYSLNVEDELYVDGVYGNKTLSIEVVGQEDDFDISCSFEGPLKPSYINISGGCDIHSPEIAYEIPGVESITIDSHLSYNGESYGNNLDFSFNGYANKDNYLDFYLSNRGTRKPIQEQEIIAPTNTQDVEEFFDEVYAEIYSDYDYGYYDDYEYTSEVYDDYTEDCYIYDNGDYSCYKYYEDKDETCNYYSETDELDCYTYDYGYKLIESEHDDYTQTCYVYDSGDTTCYKYYDDATETCYYYDATQELDCSSYNYSDWEYEIEEYTFDDHTTTCYIYNNGNTDCYEYYDDYQNTCNYVAETDEVSCYDYQYGYTLEENETDEYYETCYYYNEHETYYNDGDYTCYKYYNDKDETCYYSIETDELDCETYEYGSYYDDYYYDEAEDAVEAFSGDLDEVFQDLDNKLE